MRHPTTTRIAALAFLLPAVGCSFIAKTTDLKMNGESVSSDDKPAANVPGTRPTSTPLPSVSDAAPAPQVSDSVSALPAALKIAPAPGAPVVALKGASWCTEDIAGLDWDGAAESKFNRELKEAGNLHRSGLESMSSVARFACGGTKSADRLTWVANYMQARANETGMSADQQAHIFGVVGKLRGFDLTGFINDGPESCDGFRPKGNPNRLESEKLQMRSIAVGCQDPSSSDWMAWWVDRGTQSNSQVETLGWLYASYAYAQDDVSFERGAMAYQDTKILNDEALFADLREIGADDPLIASAMIRLARYNKKFKSWQKHHKEELGDDYEQLLAAAGAGFASWEKAYQQDKAAVDFALSVEEAVLEGDKRAFAGCSDKARKYATDFVMRSKPKTVEEIQSAAAHPIGSLIVAAAYECEKAQDRPLLASVYAEMLKEAPIARGPRFASRLALVTAVAEIKAVKSRFPLQPRDFVPPSQKDGFGHASGGYFQTGSGVVAKVDKKGDSIEVQFKKDSWQVPTFKCKETNRIDRIDSEGRLNYRKDCKQTGVETLSSQEQPIRIPAAAAAGVKAGAFMVVARSKDNSSEGLPRQVYKNKQRDTLLNYYGLELQ